MNRRKFIRAASGIFVPALVGLKAKSQVLTLADPALNGSIASAGATLQDSYSWDDKPQAIHLSHNYYYTATEFTPSVSFTLTKLELWAEQVGTPTMTLYPYIYSDSSSAPGSVITGGTGTPVALNTAPPASSPGSWFVEGFSCALTSGTSYWFVHWFNGSYSLANTVKFYAKNLAGNYAKKTDTPPTWNNADANERMAWRAYGT